MQIKSFSSIQLYFKTLVVINVRGLVKLNILYLVNK